MVAKWQRHTVAKLCRAVALHQSQWRLQRRLIWAWPWKAIWIPPVGMIHVSTNRATAKLQILMKDFSWCEFAKNAAGCNCWENCAPVGQRKCKMERLCWQQVLGAAATSGIRVGPARCSSQWMDMEASGSQDEVSSLVMPCHLLCSLHYCWTLQRNKCKLWPPSVALVCPQRTHIVLMDSKGMIESAKLTQDQNRPSLWWSSSSSAATHQEPLRHMQRHWKTPGPEGEHLKNPASVYAVWKLNFMAFHFLNVLDFSSCDQVRGRPNCSWIVICYHFIFVPFCPLICSPASYFLGSKSASFTRSSPVRSASTIDGVIVSFSPSAGISMPMAWNLSGIWFGGHVQTSAESGPSIKCKTQQNEKCLINVFQWDRMRWNKVGPSWNKVSGFGSN